jgi:hypothetical protein
MDNISVLEPPLVLLADELRALNRVMEINSESLRLDVTTFLSGLIAELRKINKTLSAIEEGHRPGWLGVDYGQIPGPLVIPEVK